MVNQAHQYFCASDPIDNVWSYILKRSSSDIYEMIDDNDCNK